MGRDVSRILQIAFGAIASLLVVPVAVNVGTSGDAPPWLKPYINWLWPVALVCVAVVIFVEWLTRREGAAVEPISGLHPDDPRNAPRALAQIAHYVEGRQKGALDEKVRLALALDERPAAVRQTVHLVQRISGADFQLSPTLGIVDVFDQMDGSLLILGAPGAGKTTLLLDLASVLAARADDTRIPVVVDLADWSRSGTRRWRLFGGGDEEPRAFAEWLLASLKRRYRIPFAVARAWLAQDRLILLLDGLDEVREPDRNRCVAEINKMQEDGSATRVVVCSREADYEKLSGRLRLQGAVSIRPLTRGQVTAYFERVSPYFARTAEALRADGDLWELLTTPLMLHIMALAQSDTAFPARSAETDRQARRGDVFDAYLVEVLARRRYGEISSSGRVLQALRLLAEGSRRVDAGVRVVFPDDMNANKTVSQTGLTVAAARFFPAAALVAATVSTAAVAAGANGLLAAAIGGLVLWQFVDLTLYETWTASMRRPWIYIAVVVLMTALSAGLMIALQRGAHAAGTDSAALPPVVILACAGTSTVLWWRDGDENRLMPFIPLAAGVAVAAVTLVTGVPRSAMTAWAAGFGTVLLVLGMSTPFLVLPLRFRRREPFNAVRITTYLACLAGMTVAIRLFAEASFRPMIAPLAGLVTGLLSGLVPALVVGLGLTAPAARLSMYVAGDLVPWRRAFLTFATDRSILTNAEGEYRFIHLLIRDHLAECDPDRLAASVEKRRAELGLA
ncbi:NACHT domain-containing protein [Actinoplanes missouriensis]|uniref:NACHT domain-containing protein n=1 Tax=Actinoplanes missouriensis TaxID=1866 RepID=UPI00340A0F70